MRKFLGWIVLGGGCWMLVSAQARIGLTELRWMDRYAFSGEVLVAVVVLGFGYFLLDLRPPR